MKERLLVLTLLIVLCGSSAFAVGGGGGGGGEVGPPAENPWQLTILYDHALPDASSWVTALEVVFVAGAGLGLGVLGLSYVVSMIGAGVNRRG